MSADRELMANTDIGDRVLIRWPHHLSGKRGVVTGVQETGTLWVRLDSGWSAAVRPHLVKPDPYLPPGSGS